jgi:hypothetical protein
MFQLALTWLRRLTACGVLLAIVVGMLSGVGNWQQQYWMESQRAYFEQLPPDRVLPAVRALAAEGTAALPELVSALGSMQASVATAAQVVVLEELERLEARNDRKASQSRVILSEALAQHVPEFGPTTTRFAAHLAERLLRDDQELLTASERMRLIGACGTVLNRASRELDEVLLARAHEANWQETPPPIPWEATIALVRETERQHEQRLAASFAGGGIGPDGVAVPALPEVALESISRQQGTAELTPKPLPEVSGAMTDESYEQPEKFRKPLALRRLHKQADTNAAGDSDPSNASVGTNPPERFSTRESAVRQALPAPTHGNRRGGPPRDETMIRLLQALVAADEQAANRAATALTQRGLPREHLELAKQLADPDPAVRKSLVEILPRTAGLDARPWLLWLAHDDHPDVRLAAMSMLATSQDPNLCEQIERLARNDYDERIVALADRLLQRRTGK